MAHVNTTRGVPFDPAAATAMRQQHLAQAHELDVQARKKALREHGRRLDAEQRERRRQKRKRVHQEIDDAWYEYRTGHSRLATG